MQGKKQKPAQAKTSRTSSTKEAGTPAQPEQGCFQSNEEKPKPEQGPSQPTATKEETVPEGKKPKPNAENASKPAEAEQAVEPEPQEARMSSLHKARMSSPKKEMMLLMMVLMMEALRISE